MTYPWPGGLPGLAGLTQQISVPGVTKIPVSCCGYTCIQPAPAPWCCPGCGTWHNAA